LIFYDQRGGGRSRDTGHEPVGWQHHVEDLSHVVRELHLEPLTIIGYSWGGLLALLYALEAHRHGEHHAPMRMVLVDPAPLSRPFRQAFEDEFARRRGARRSEMREDLLTGWGRVDLTLASAPVGSVCSLRPPQAAVALTPFR
jgi:proline iminopeptidase